MKKFTSSFVAGL